MSDIDGSRGTARTRRARPPAPRRTPGGSTTGKAWKRFTGLGLAAAAAHFALPAGDGRGVVYLALAASSVAAVAAGVRVNRPAHRTPWVLLGAGLTLFLAGDVCFYWYQLVRHVERPFPSLADAFYLSSYPLLSAGLLSITRRRNPDGDRAGLIDACIVATAMTLVVQVYVIGPAFADTETSWLDRLISVVYPLCDVLLLAVVVRLAPTGRSRRAPFVFVLLAGAGLLAADLAYLVVQLNGNFDVGTYFDVGWMAFYICLGAAALHPAMGAIGEPGPPTGETSGRVRLVLMGAILLVAPTVLAVEWARGDDGQLPFVAMASAALSLLVAARLAGLMRSLGDVAVRERILGAGAAALGAAPDRDAIHAAAIRTARDLAGPAARRVHLAVWSSNDVVDAAFAARADGDPPPPPVPAEAAGVISLQQLDALLAHGDGPERGAVVTPVLVHDELQGAIVVVADETIPPGARQALDTLATQMGTALDRELLTTELHGRRGEARFRSLVQNSSDVIAVVDADSTIRYHSPSAQLVLGHAPAELLGTRLVDMTHPEDLTLAVSFLEDAAGAEGSTPPVLLRLRRADDGYVTVEAVGNNLLGDANVAGIVVTLRDVSERIAFESEIRHQSLHDALTSLPNRALLADRIEGALRRRALRDRTVAVVVLDLDDFKTVNDSLGHAAGDRLLVGVAARLAACIGPADTLARVGGDEFAVLLDDLPDHDGGTMAANRLAQVLAAPFDVGGPPVSVDVSVGIAFAADGMRPGELVRNADVAMHTAKVAGKGRSEVFAPHMHEAVLRRLHLTADLQRAVDRGQLLLHYQPIVDIASGRVVGVEALVRWLHPTRGLVMPDEFVPLAEETNLILPLGRWVLETSLRQARSWHRAFGTTMSVNLSRQQLTQPGLPDEVVNLVQRLGIQPAAVTLEVTESVMMHAVEPAVRALSALRATGMRVAIDDFGTGYSSLATLRQLPVDVLKIDKAFIRGVAKDDGDAVLVGSVLDLAHGLGLLTVAEGIEDDDQLAFLARHRCGLGQGFHLARPLPAHEVERLLAAGPQVLPQASGT